MRIVYTNLFYALLLPFYNSCYNSGISKEYFLKGLPLTDSLKTNSTKVCILRIDFEKEFNNKFNFIYSDGKNLYEFPLTKKAEKIKLLHDWYSSIIIYKIIPINCDSCILKLKVTL